MLKTIINALIAAVKSFFGIKDPPTSAPEPSTADLAAQAASNNSQLHQEQAANEIVTKGTAARTGATATIVRDTTGTPSDATAPRPSVNEELKRDFPGDFRD